MPQKNRDSTRRFIKFFTITLRVIVLGPILLGGIVLLLIYFSEANRNFRKLRIGMDQAQVKQIMGKPRIKSESIEGLCRLSWWEKQCAEAGSKNIKTYLHWKSGIDSLHLVGLNNKGNVAFLAQGDT